MTLYSFDTSVLIESWISPGSADHVRVLLGAPRRDHQRGHGPSRLRVRNELTRDDNLKAWAKLRGELFVPLEHDVQRATTRVLEYAERMVGMGKGATVLTLSSSRSPLPVMASS